MPSSNQEKILPYNCNDLFDIVIDIKKYPDFIPWIAASRIIEKKDNFIIADLIIRYKLFNESFRSHVKYNKKEHKILVTYTEGPLKSLYTKWKFSAINNKKTLLKFELNFEFKFNPFNKLASKFYKILEEKLIVVFEKRAKEILN